jgi:hypothetical protein
MRKLIVFALTSIVVIVCGVNAMAASPNTSPWYVESTGIVKVSPSVKPVKSPLVKPSSKKPSSKKTPKNPLITPKQDIVELEIISDVKTDMVFNYVPKSKGVANLFVVLSKENNYTFKSKVPVGYFSLKAGGGYVLIPEYPKLEEIDYPKEIILEKGKPQSIKITKIKPSEAPKQSDKIEVIYDDDKTKEKPKYGFLNYVIYGIIGIAGIVLLIKVKFKGR